MPATRAKALPYQRPIRPKHRPVLRPEDRVRLLQCFPDGIDQAKAEEAVDALPTIVALFKTGLDVEWAEAQRKILEKSLADLDSVVTVLATFLDGSDQVTRRRILRALAGGPGAPPKRRKVAENGVRQFAAGMQEAVATARERLTERDGRSKSPVEWLLASIQKNWVYATGRKFRWFKDAKRSPEASRPRQYAICIASVFKLKHDVLTAYQDGEGKQALDNESKPFRPTKTEAIHIFDLIMDGRPKKVKAQTCAGDESDASDQDS